MANTDIRLMLSFRNHPKTKKLRLKLGNDGVISFIWLMMFAAENKPDGVFSGMDADDIGLAADYPGDLGEFVEVLVAVRYLNFDGETYSMHDWADHQPWAAGAEERSRKARHAADVRHGNKLPAESKNQQVRSKTGATSNDKQCKKDKTAVPNKKSSNAPSPILSSPSPSPNTSSAGPQGDPTQDEGDDPPPDPVFLTIPLVDKSDFEVTESKVDEFRECYPGIDVEQHLRNIKGWNINNPKNRKTRRGILRHINSWLGDKQDKATRNLNGTSRQTGNSKSNRPLSRSAELGKQVTDIYG